MTVDAPSRSFGRLLSEWRRARGRSQLALATDAAVSPRHVSFVESGRSRPSEQMVITLADALGVPLRERNAMLLAAGYAPHYRELSLDAPELSPARRAIDLILQKQEPFPAVVMSRQWDIVTSNEAAKRFFGALLEPDAPATSNVLRLMFHPRGLRPWVANWEPVAEALVQRVHREAVGGHPDAATLLLLREIVSYPGVPARFKAHDPTRALAPLLAIAFRKGELDMTWFSSVTTLGTPQDVTLQELRIECFHPGDDATAEAAARLAAS